MKDRGPDWIYFIQAAYNGLVKIGKTNDIDGRVAYLGRMSAVPIFLLAKLRGGHPVEKYFHTLFADFRDHGEWFCPHDSLLATVKRIKAVAVDGFCGDMSRTPPHEFVWLDTFNDHQLREEVRCHLETFNRQVGPEDCVDNEHPSCFHRIRAIAYAKALKARTGESIELTFDPQWIKTKAEDGDDGAFVGKWFGYERLVRLYIGTPAETVSIA